MTSSVKGVTIFSIGLLFFITPADAKKNVLFLMSDDFNYWVQAAGYNKQAHTPNLNKLARKGVLFTKAYNASPVCNPSRNAIQSGYRPRTTGVTGNEAGFVREKAGFENVVTLHQYFKENGYYTLAGGKIYHAFVMQASNPKCDPKNWTEIIDASKMGFWNGCSGPADLTWSDQSNYETSWLQYKRLTVDCRECDGYKVAGEIVKRLKGYSASPNRDKPFFMAFGEFRPHLPFESPQSFWKNWNTADIQLPEGYNPSVWPQLGVKATAGHSQVLKENKHQEIIHAYLASMAYADSSIGIILDALEASPYRDNTIVTFCGDHGFHLGEKGDYAKAKQWEQANHTSLIIYDPSAAGNGRISTKVVSLQDLYPTLVELAGLPRKDDIEGVSLAPLLDAPDHSSWNYPILISHNNNDFLKTQEWSYLPNWNGSKYLFNRITDPHEWKNVWNDNPAVVAKLQKQMDSIIAIGTQLKTKLLARVTFKKTNHVIPGVIEAEDYDDGAEGQDFHDLDAANTGDLYRKDGVDIKATSDGSGFEVFSTAAGEWLIYTIPNFSRGAYSLTARVYAGGRAGKLAVYVDNHFAGDIVVNNAAGWQEARIEKFSVTGSGYKKLKVVVTEGSPSLNHFTIGSLTSVGAFTIENKGLPAIIQNRIVRDGKLRLDLTGMDITVNIAIMTLQGKTVINETVNAEIYESLDLKGRLPRGRYILRALDWMQKSRTEWFVVK